MCKKGCKKGFCSCIRTTDPGLFDHAPSVDKTARFPLRYWKAGEALHNYYLSFEDIALKVNNTPVGYVPTTSGNLLNLNSVVIDSSGDKWIIDILGNAIKMPTGGGGTGTVTSFSSGNLSPLFTTSVATPTTTPALSFTLSNVSQYQVFGRSAAGSGVPSWVTLPSTAFTGYTAGTGISIAGNVITNTLVGKFVALADADAGYSNNIGATDPNTITKSQFSYSGGHANMFLGGGGYLLTNSVTNQYGFQLAVDTTGVTIGFRGNYIGTWGSWNTFATQSWVNTNFYQYWTYSGSTIHPHAGFAAYGVSTYPGAGYGYAALITGGTSTAGRLDIYSTSGVRQGFIGYYSGELGYVANVGNHHFYGGGVQIDSVTNNNTSGYIVVLGSGNLLQYRDLSSISIGSNVWRIIGGNTIATSITDSIWHNANVKLGDGSSGSNSYRLQVVGTSYFTQTMLINNSTAFNALNASASPVEVFKVDSSNNWLFAASHIKVNATDIYIDQYPNTRSDSFYTVQAARLMYTDSNGKILLTDKKAFYNDHVSAGSKTQQGHAADSTWRRLTNDLTYGSISFGTQFNTNGTTFACQIPRTDQRFWLVSVIEYENQSGSSGTPVIDLQIRINGSTTGVVFSDWSEATTGVRNTVTIQSILYTAGGGGYFDVDIYIRVATGSGSIYVNKHDTVITNVGYIPS